MFSKQTIIKHTKILLSLLTIHFVLTTFIKFQLGQDMGLSFLNIDLINLWKDIYLTFIYSLIIGYTIKHKTYSKLLKNKLLNGIFIILILLSFVVTFLNWHGIKSLIIGFKYDLWFLFSVIFYQLVNFNKKDKKNFYNFFLKLIKFSIIGSLIFAFIRYTIPKFLFLLGYGPLGDWYAGKSPPMYFDTGLYGIQRLSGLFSGPNHMAFYFVAFGPLILFSIFYKKLHWIWGILYLTLLFGSLSRSGILAFFVEIILISTFIFIYNKNLKKSILITLITFGGLTSILGVYLIASGKYHQIIIRGSSTTGHIKRVFKTLKAIKQKPLIGHGLGTAGPAAHYIKSNIIPESWFLQIFYELGFIGGLLRFAFILLIILKLYKQANKNAYLSKEDILKISLSIGIVGLLIQGLVLHSFEDSMISLPLFILIGITLEIPSNKF